MSRPRSHDKWTTTAMRFPPELLDELRRAAAERDLSVNYLVNAACREFLARLLPVDEIKWTR